MTLGANITNYDGGLEINDGVTGTCNTTNCHNRAADKSNAWDVAAALACNDCHADAAGAGPALSATHTAHFTEGYGCAACHVNPAAEDTAHIGGTATLADKATAAQNEASLAANGTYLLAGEFGDVEPDDETCSNAACHDASNTGYSAAWNTTNGQCTFCHSATNPATGSHTAHMTGSTQALGGAVVCASCHESHGTNYGHLDGTTRVAVRVNGTVTVKAAPTALDGCGTNDCHNDGKNAAPAAYTWGTTIGGLNSCGDCHAAAPGSEAHGAHLNASGAFGIMIACTNCHTTATAASHANGTVTLLAAFNGTYAAGSLTVGDAAYSSCGTNSCHENGKGGAPNVTPYNWDTTQANCTLCHASPNEAGNDGLRHKAHADSTVYVAGCAACHTAATASTHLNSTTNLAAVTYNATNGTCTNNCHAVADGRDWNTTGTLACTECHGGAAGYIGNNSGAYLPATGLHTGTPTVSANAHDASWKKTRNEGTATGVCETCHTASPSSAHLDGTFTASAPTITFDAMWCSTTRRRRARRRERWRAATTTAGHGRASGARRRTRRAGPSARTATAG